jgi:hypothetical protein
MAEIPPEIKVDLKEPYPNFFTTLHNLMLDQIEFTRLRILIIKIAMWIAIVYIVLSILLCVLSILLPIFGAGIFAWLAQNIRFTNGQ